MNLIPIRLKLMYTFRSENWKKETNGVEIANSELEIHLLRKRNYRKVFTVNPEERLQSFPLMDQFFMWKEKEKNLIYIFSFSIQLRMRQIHFSMVSLNLLHNRSSGRLLSSKFKIHIFRLFPFENSFVALMQWIFCWNI